MLSPCSLFLILRDRRSRGQTQLESPWVSQKAPPPLHPPSIYRRHTQKTCLSVAGEAVLLLSSKGAVQVGDTAGVLRWNPLSRVQLFNLDWKWQMFSRCFPMSMEN